MKIILAGWTHWKGLQNPQGSLDCTLWTTDLVDSRGKTWLFPVLEDAINRDVRPTSDWWGPRNFTWMEALLVTAGDPPNYDKAHTMVCWMWRRRYLWEWPFHPRNIWNWGPCLFDMILDTVTHVPVNSLLWPSLEIISFWVWVKNYEG